MNILFGHSQMSENELFDNLKKLTQKFGEAIPRGVANIKSITLQVRYLELQNQFFNDSSFSLELEVCSIFSIRKFLRNYSILKGTGTMAIPVYRNEEIDPKIEEMCGMELERKAGHEQMKVIL